MFKVTVLEHAKMCSYKIQCEYSCIHACILNLVHVPRGTAVYYCMIYILVITYSCTKFSSAGAAWPSCFLQAAAGQEWKVIELAKTCRRIASQVHVKTSNASGGYRPRIASVTSRSSTNRPRGLMYFQRYSIKYVLEHAFRFVRLDSYVQIRTKFSSNT